MVLGYGSPGELTHPNHSKIPLFGLKVKNIYIFTGVQNNTQDNKSWYLVKQQEPHAVVAHYLA